MYLKNRFVFACRFELIRPKNPSATKINVGKRDWRLWNTYDLRIPDFKHFLKEQQALFSVRRHPGFPVNSTYFSFLQKRLSGICRGGSVNFTGRQNWRRLMFGTGQRAGVTFQDLCVWEKHKVMTFWCTSSRWLFKPVINVRSNTTWKILCFVLSALRRMWWICARM